MKKLLSVLVLLLFSTCFAADIDDKIAQMIIVGFDGNSTHSRGYKKVLKQLKKNEISGVILFSKNIKSKNSLIKMNEKMFEKSATMPFIAIDNEGGKVQRYDFKHYKSAKEISKMKPKKARNEYAKMADLENKLRINVNLAPCVDLEINPDSIIKKKERSYGSDYKKVSEYARIFVEEHNKQKIATAIKHFPGHGSVKGDTHKGMVDSTKTFSKDEFMPYYELKDLDKLNMVMISHIYNSDFDEKHPASLSQKVVKEMLVDTIGFKGVIISDDYDMGAIRDNYSLREIVVNSINAGVDIMLFSNNSGKKEKNLPLQIRNIVKEELKNGNIKFEDIEKSYQKITTLKKNLE